MYESATNNHQSPTKAVTIQAIPCESNFKSAKKSSGRKECESQEAIESRVSQSAPQVSKQSIEDAEMSNPSISQESIKYQEPAQCEEADQEMEQESEMKEFESAKISSKENVEQINSPENSEKIV